MSAHSLKTPSRRLLVTAATLACALGLLAGIGQVARDAVRQGAERQQATARRSQAIWRCTTLRGTGSRDLCLKALDGPPAADAQAYPQDRQDRQGP